MTSGWEEAFRDRDVISAISPSPLAVGGSDRPFARNDKSAFLLKLGSFLFFGGEWESGNVSDYSGSAIRVLLLVRWIASSPLVFFSLRSQCNSERSTANNITGNTVAEMRGVGAFLHQYQSHGIDEGFFDGAVEVLEQSLFDYSNL